MEVVARGVTMLEERRGGRTSRVEVAREVSLEDSKSSPL